MKLIHFVIVIHAPLSCPPSPDLDAADRLGRKRAIRGEEILDRAMEIVAEDGVAGLTLQKVAASLGYVPAALYRYFGSKDALLAALQRRAVASMHEGFRTEQAAWTAASAGLADEVAALGALLRAARFYLRVPETDPRAFRLVAMLLGDPRELVSDEEARKAEPLLLGLLAEVHALFEHAQAVGALAPGDGLERALALWSALQGALMLAKGRRL
ncbi:MAG: helix-turn-helix domain containing protein, partial [Proteobacteria bacterium]|nr:helix-turn-helix domain containing protein [Pseudomonadota bacterium]